MDDKICWWKDTLLSCFYPLSELLASKHFNNYTLTTIFAYSRWHHLWVQNGVVCVVICDHLNMLWICFGFIQEDMRAGVAVEPWDTCFLIWINCVCGNNASSYLTTMLSKLHEILQRPWRSTNTLTYQILWNSVMICQRYWTFTIFHAIITPATKNMQPNWYDIAL